MIFSSLAGGEVPGDNPFARLEKTAEFYIIRHGESEGNAAGIFQGRGEYPLSGKGRLQAAARGCFLKEALAGTGPEKILLFSSPLGRAAETAGIIAREAGFSGELPLHADILAEMDLGVWTGRSRDEIKAGDTSLWAAFNARSWDAVPGAETSAALYDRALDAWAFLCGAAAAKGAEKVIAVTHGGFIQWLLKTTLGCRTWFPLFPVSNCGLSQLRAEVRPEQNAPGLYWKEINSPVVAAPSALDVAPFRVETF